MPRRRFRDYFGVDRWIGNTRTQRHVRAPAIVQLDNMTPTGPSLANFSTRGIRGRAKVFIHNAVDKNQQTTLRCSLEPIVNARLIEIPQWMFDAASLCGVRWADAPTVSGEALLELKALLSSVGKQRDDLVLQAQQPSLARTGETD